MTLCRTLLTCLFLIASFPVLAKAEFIRLQNGSYVEGDIIAFDEEGFTFTSKTSSQPRHILWSNIDPVFSQKLRKERQLQQSELAGASDFAEEVMALRIKMKSGGELLGVLVQKDEDALHMVKRGMAFSIPNDSVESIARELVDAREVYREEDLTTMYIQQVKPETAKDFKAYGDYCRTINAYPEALVAYEKAINLDSAMQEDLQPSIALMVSLMNNRAVLEKYKAIRKIAFVDQDFDMAKRMIDDEMRSSLTMSDLADRMLVEMEEERKDSIRKKMAHYYFRKMHRECWRIARLGFGYEHAMEQLDVVKERAEGYAMEKLNIDQKTFDELWADRNRKGNWVMLRMASFGSGTFLSTKEGGARAAATSNRRSSSASASEKNYSKTREVGEIASVPEWWSSRSVNERWSFLKSIYAEKNLEIERVHSHACANCGGTGSRKTINWDKSHAKDPTGETICTVCRGQRVYKEIRYH